MTEIAKTYSPTNVEAQWYDSWLKNNCFKGEVVKDKESYCIMIPPPNVTGVLTMGHVLNNTLQDVLCRLARQEGKSVLWLPGTDHAGIATQTRVEKELKRNEGKSRHDIGRDAFVEKAKYWRDTHGGLIFKQLQRLGVSCDWGRSVHTLDEDYSKAVLTSFVELYNRGYIYRGKRMVNWCPVSHTALSDEEVIMKSLVRKLYKVRYELVEKPGTYIEICTTRPETIMGDSGVAVNPEDERYSALIGQKVWRPLERAQIPIIGDSAVEKDFGTGALKVTPAHDPIDFEIGKRHGLEIIDTIDHDGRMNSLAGKNYAGLHYEDARKKAVKELEGIGALIDAKPYESNVGHSERADVPVMPRISEQWFLKYPKVEEAKEVIRQGMIKFWPQRWEKVYLHWLENIQDWCISRQLWWGHRIPVWYKKGQDRSLAENWHVSLEGPSDPENWEQDEDVLDTWASSWLWPFATLGWPDEQAMEERGLHYFYPTSDLVTGPDIIFFWVARMIMAGLEFMGPEAKQLSLEQMKPRIPFENVYFTGIIRDAQGRKMSKSLGNSPDPLELIDKYGADGLRFGIISIAPQGQDILFAEERVEQGRNFCNKLWNACRFRQLSGEIGDDSSIAAIASRMNVALFDADDHSIISQLMATLDSTRSKLKSYEFNGALQDIYAFFWNDFCAWYLEVSKTKLQDDKLKANCLAIQDLVLRQTLLMLHPFTPFISEDLWHGLGYGKDSEFIQNENAGSSDSLSSELSGAGIKISPEAVGEIAALREFVAQGRALKANHNLAAKMDVKFNYKCTPQEQKIIEQHLGKIKKLMGAGTLEWVEDAPEGPAMLTPLGTLFIDLKGSIDVVAEQKRIEKELEKLNKIISSSEVKLSNEKFLSQAPEKVVEESKALLEKNKAKRQELEKLIGSIS